MCEAGGIKNQLLFTLLKCNFIDYILLITYLSLRFKRMHVIWTLLSRTCINSKLTFSGAALECAQKHASFYVPLIDLNSTSTRVMMKNFAHLLH